MPAFSASAALADPPDKLPPLAVAGRETFDVFNMPAGTDPRSAVLNKIQISAIIRGERLGLNGWLIHGQINRYDGQKNASKASPMIGIDPIDFHPKLPLGRPDDGTRPAREVPGAGLA